MKHRHQKERIVLTCFLPNELGITHRAIQNEDKQNIKAGTSTQATGEGGGGADHLQE